MPNPLTRFVERAAEFAAQMEQEGAEALERLNITEDLDLAYQKAADAWRKVAAAYAAKARRHHLPIEGYTQSYACRAAEAWLRVARNCAKAASYASGAAARALGKQSGDAYREAAKMAEACATGHLERGELVLARGEFEQAQFCYERCGDDADAERVGRLAARVEDAIESGTLKED